MGELADAVLLNHPTLTKMIDRMVSDTLVYRVQDPNDRRKVLMFISDRGKVLSKKPTRSRWTRRSTSWRATATSRRANEAALGKPDRQLELERQTVARSLHNRSPDGAQA